MSEFVSTDKLDYLQRLTPPADTAAGPVSRGLPDRRLQLRLRGVGRLHKERQAQAQRPADERWRPPTSELITGLYGYRIPLAYSIDGTPAGVDVRLGTWSMKDTTRKVQQQRLDVMQSVLRGLYPSIDAVIEAERGGMRWTSAGVVLGTPAPAGVEETDGAAPIDRIVRAMDGSSWRALVLAYPVSERVVGRTRDSLLNEMRSVTTAALSEGASSPLAEQYVELLRFALRGAGECLTTGAWRTAVYLLGDEESYPRLASVWRSVMSGERSLPEPVRVLESEQAVSLADDWGLPDDEGAPGPGMYQRPFEYQTLLASNQLASYVHLPELETPGFSISVAHRFDSAPSGGSTDGVLVGNVIHNGRMTTGGYRVDLRSLTKHAFVAGLTGSGKTNTIFALLLEADRQGVPFLVVEPAKTEYRALLRHASLGDRIRVFTAGQSSVSPLVLNPFDVPDGTSVSEHLDLLRAAFTAAFGMWTPLPQILERCLHEVYEARGWDLRTSTNRRLAAGSPRSAAFPTLSDLIDQARDVFDKLGYDDRVRSDLEAALLTRLESLRRGGKGAMLDVTRSLPDEELFGQPTVIELEAMGDEGDKAFLAGLLLIRLAEYRRAHGQSKDLQHLLVIEEAHRLLANVGPAAEGFGNPRAQAVETFANLLSEIRAYGQGVIIADQVPVRLAPDVMKNTNLKIAHRIVSADDRDALAAAMAMNERQAHSLPTLRTGEAAVFSGGDDAPVLVQIPLAKGTETDGTPPADEVRKAMTKWRERNRYDELFHPQEFCARTCADSAVCEAGRVLARDEYMHRAVTRLILSISADAGAVDRLWDDIAMVVRANRPPDLREQDVMRSAVAHAAEWYAARRGAQGKWSYVDTVAVADRLRAMLLAQAAGKPDKKARNAVRELLAGVQVRAFDPYPACGMVCKQDPPMCLYRSAVADLVMSRRYHDSWNAADAKDATSEDKRRRETWEVCQDAAYELAEFPTEELSPAVRESVDLNARRICLCFEQQMLAQDDRKVPRTSRRILSKVLTEGGF